MRVEGAGVIYRAPFINYTQAGRPRFHVKN
jgi:hypothetical protein